MNIQNDHQNDQIKKKAVENYHKQNHPLSLYRTKAFIDYIVSVALTPVNSKLYQ